MDDFYARYFPHDGDAVLGYHLALQARLGEARDVLDCGCGDNTDLAPYRSPTRAVWGVDFQPHPQLADPAWFRPLGPGGAVPFPAESFDVVGARWVLEHVQRPAVFLGEVYRLLRPGGWFVGLTVHAGHYVTLMTRLLRLLPHSFTQRLVQRLYGRPPHDTFPTYYRLNTPLMLRRHARRAGFEVTQVARFANPDYFSFSPRLCHTAVLLDYLLERSNTGRGRLYMVVTLRKPPPALHAAA
jgi:SAM-dependent methyltransferase